jgi:hypothetical protein
MPSCNRAHAHTPRGVCTRALALAQACTSSRVQQKPLWALGLQALCTSCTRGHVLHMEAFFYYATVCNC